MRKSILILILFVYSFCAAQKAEYIKLHPTAGNLHEIRAEINNTVKLKFLLDGGASEVCVPPIVVRTLVLAKTVSVKDTLQGAYYTFANGESAYCRRFIIRKLRIGKVTLRNVSCVVSNTDNGVLLFGQSALKKFKRYKVDNQRNLLIIWR